MSASTRAPALLALAVLLHASTAQAVAPETTAPITRTVTDGLGNTVAMGSCSSQCTYSIPANVTVAINGGAPDWVSLAAQMPLACGPTGTCGNPIANLRIRWNGAYFEIYGKSLVDGGTYSTDALGGARVHAVPNSCPTATPGYTYNPVSGLCERCPATYNYNPTTHACDCAACSCSAVVPPPISVALTKELKLGPYPCALIGGSTGTKVTLDGTGTGDVPTCNNGCVGKGSFAVKGSAEFSLCSNTVKVDVGGSLTQSRSYVPGCDQSTCQANCGAGNCSTEDAKGNLGLTVSRSFGLAWSKSFAGGSASVKCGGSLSASGTVNGALNSVTNNGDTRPCVGCSTSTVTLTGGGGAAANCAVDLSFRGARQEVGCKKCASFDVTLSGTGSEKSGACGSQSCTAITSTVKGAASLPKMDLKRLWWGVEGVCAASATGCGETNTCGTCTCGGAACEEFKLEMTCSVCSNVSVLKVCVGGP